MLVGTEAFEVYDIDDDADYEPIWLTAPRGFVDLSASAAESFNNLLSNHLQAAVESWSCNEDGWTFALHDLTIEVRNDIMSTSVVVTSRSVPRKYLDPMRVQLRDVLHEQLQCSCWCILDFAASLLQVTEEAIACLRDWKKAPKKPTLKPSITLQQWRLRKRSQKEPAKEIGWDASTVTDWTAIHKHAVGVNLLTVRDTAKHLLGQSVAEICKDIPDWLRILHVEPVFRDDLAERFLQRRLEMRKQLLELSHNELRECVSHKEIRSGEVVDTHQGIVDALTQTKMTFHGAPRHAIASIVRHGFILPGQRIGNGGGPLEIRCGASFGVGIYSSPDPVFASLYMRYEGGEVQQAVQPSQVPGMRLLICATLMGKSLSQVSRSGRVLTMHRAAFTSGLGCTAQGRGPRPRRRSLARLARQVAVRGL